MRLKFCQLFDYTQLNEEEMSHKKIKLWEYHNHMYILTLKLVYERYCVFYCIVNVEI